MGARTWATFGNVLKIFSLPLFLSSGLLAYGLTQPPETAALADFLPLFAVFAAVNFVFAVLFWNAKGPLISGNPIARLLVGVYMLMWVVSTLGFALIFIVLVYLFTSDPDFSSFSSDRPRSTRRRFKPPRNWQPSGQIGGAGATVYADAGRGRPVAMLDSWLPVQVLDRRSGYAMVVAATGEGGWIDDRTLNEAV